MDIDNEDIQCGPFDIFYCGQCKMCMLTVNYKQSLEILYRYAAFLISHFVNEQ